MLQNRGMKHRPGKTGNTKMETNVEFRDLRARQAIETQHITVTGAEN